MRATRTRQSFRLPPASEPNVIPFIDVLLVLLIIFMVTSPGPTVDLRLEMAARGASAPPIIEPTLVSVERSAGPVPRVLVNGAAVEFDRLAERVLAHVRAQNPSISLEDAHSDARVFVRADQDIAYARVVEVIDRLQRAHFAKVAVAAQNADQD